MSRILTILLIVGAIAYFAFHYTGISDTTNVTVISPQRGPIKNAINLTGRVINDRTVTLSALVNGQITEMKISKGQQVSKDQVLARFDRREADALVEKLAAEYELAEERARLARDNLDRLANMGSNSSVSEQQLEQARSDHLIARTQLKISRSSHIIAKIQREKYDVTAPFDGVITEKTTEVGQWVEAGTPLFTLVARDGREIEVKIDSSDRALIKLNQQASVSAEAWPEQVWQESIHWLSPAVLRKGQENLNDFTARLTLGNAAPPLILGQQVDVELVLERKDDALTLPYSVLIEKDDSKQLAIVGSDSRIELIEIEIGIEDVTRFEVKDPRIGQETRIARPQQAELTQGQTVAIE
jgi:RND family efflux transporter MFP subunit